MSAAAQTDFARALEGAPLFKSLEWHEEIDSTQTRTLALAGDGAAPGTLVVAERQTAGTGRYGHKWASPAGGLWFSLIVEPPAGPLPISIIAALAARHILIQGYGLGVRLKWPNDLFVLTTPEGIEFPAAHELPEAYWRPRKVGGVIATERAGRMVLGVGLNTNVEPADLPPEVAAIATSMRAESGLERANPGLLRSFLQKLERRFREAARAPAELHDEAWAALVRKHPVRWRPPGGAAPRAGTIIDLEPNGGLAIEVDGERVVAVAGDLEILWPTSA